MVAPCDRDWLSSIISSSIIIPITITIITIVSIIGTAIIMMMLINSTKRSTLRTRKRQGLRSEGPYHKAPPPTILPAPRTFTYSGSRVPPITTPPKPPRPARGGPRRPRPLSPVAQKSPRWQKPSPFAPGRLPPRSFVSQAFCGRA